MTIEDKKKEAIRLRTEERLSIINIAKIVHSSRRDIGKWLENHPLTEAELEGRCGNAKKDASGKFTGDLVKRARAQGQKYYTSGSICRNGHKNPRRRVGSGACYECEKQRRLAYLKMEHRLHPEKVMWKGAKHRAKVKNIPFTITVEDVQRVWPSDNQCPILHIPLKINEGSAALPNSPTLDKIRPELGYIPGNIAVISHKANSLKRDETDPQVFRAIADWIEQNGHRLP